MWVGTGLGWVGTFPFVTCRRSFDPPCELDVVRNLGEVCVCEEFCRICKKLVSMAASAGAATMRKDVMPEDPKLDVFEDDDEFEEFESEVWDDADEGTEALQQWENDWDDDDVTDDFSVQLKKEIEAEK